MSAGQIRKLGDGRIIASVDPPMLGLAEISLATFTGDDVRGAVDVYVEPNGDHRWWWALLRVYARVGAVRTEVGRGRVRELAGIGVLPPPQHALRVRGVVAESIEITVQFDPASPGSPQPPGQVHVTIVLSHEVASLGLRPMTIKRHMDPNVAGALPFSRVPVHLFGLIATAGASAVDRWIMLFDEVRAIPLPDGALPVVPGLYVAPGSKSVSSLDFGDRPLEFVAGVDAIVSSSPYHLVRDVGANLPTFLVEYL